jgi:pilus assembly protein CpaC
LIQVGYPTVSRRRSKRDERFRSAIAAAVLGAAGLLTSAGGSLDLARAQVIEAPSVRHVTVTINKSKTLTFDSPYSTAVIGAPDLADILPMTVRTLYVQAKKIGTTNISVFDGAKRLVAVVDLDIEPDTASLSSRIASSSGGKNINITSANGQVILSGEASDAVSAAHAVDVAKGLATDASGKPVPVIDAMKVAPSQQVMLEVRFLEVDRNAGRDLGVSLFGGNKNGIGISGLGTVSNNTGALTTSCTTGATSCATAAATNSVGSGTGGIGGQIIGGLANNIFGGTFTGAAVGSTPFGALLAQVVNMNGLRIDTLITALEDKGLVRTLAEPNLIALSGQQASFFAGGQIPVPTVQPGTVGSVPTVSVQYYNCGVQLNFVPTVLSTGVINVQLAPQVCEVSASGGSVVVNGTTIPELTTRTANTTVELRDGQSFAIAGLLEAQNSNSISSTVK